MEEQNKSLVLEGFRNWAEGTGSFFDLLADNVEWTIPGNSAIANVYRSKQQFLNEVIIPLNKRLKHSIIPVILEIYTDGDAVLVLWEGKCTALDGLPYLNTYSWFLLFNEGKIRKVTAFFDAKALDDLWYRIKV